MKRYFKQSLKLSASALVIGSLSSLSYATDVENPFDPGLQQTSVSQMAPVSVKAYQEEEAHYVKTAKKLSRAKTQKEYNATLAELTQSATTVLDMAERGAQAELMRDDIVEKTSFISKIKKKLPSFGKKDKSSKSKALPAGVQEINVLSLDGGGVRGIGTLAMLGMLEMKTGKKTHELFDRIYGTSTGGLMAVMLASGMRATDVLDVYLDNMGTIFGRSWKDTLANPLGLFGANYDPAGLESVINKYMPGKTLKDALIPVAVTCVDAKTGSVRLLSSEDEDTRDVPVLQAGRATSAAPTYFPQMKVDAKSGSFMAMDGGVMVNNPSKRAYNHTLDIFEGQKIKVNMLSLGTGAEDRIQLDTNAGKLGFGSPGNIPGFFMGNQAQDVEDEMQRLNKKGKASYNRFQFSLPFAIDLADTSDAAKKLLMQEAWMRANQSDFSEYVRGLNLAERT